MSEDNKYDDPFDLDSDILGESVPPANTDNGAFDLESPFGDEMAMPSGEAQVSADNPFLDSVAETDGSDVFDSETPAEEADSAVGVVADKKKKGFFGRSSGGKTKAPKEKKEKKVKAPKEKKEPIAKGSVPRDWGTILCVAFSLFLLVSILMFNITVFLFPKLANSDGGIMQTICFLGAFNLVALAAAAVPILFYKYPNERTLPNVMLGIAAVALLVGVQICVYEFYQYSFTVSLKT